MTRKQQREHWIDTLKAICIICVYIAHCEAFYCPGHNIARLVVAPFYVNAFFFINGYLIIRKYFKENRIVNYSRKEYWKNIEGTIFRLVIPTIIFSAIIYLPKNNFGFDLKNFTAVVLGGVSLWFTSALSVSQFVIYTLLLSRKRNIWIYILATFSIFLLTNAFGDVRSKPALEYIPWFWQTGLLYTLLMMLGGAYYVYENKINTLLKKPIIANIVFASYAILMTLQWNGLEFYCLGLSGKSNFIGYLLTIISILCLVHITKHIKTSRITEFIGRQSIVFYFLSGAVPSVILFLIKGLQMEHSSLMLVLYTIFSFSISYFATYLITRYFPFLLDIRNLFKSPNKL